MSMEKQPGDLKRKVFLPADTFSREDMRDRRTSCFQRGVRSRLVLHEETPKNKATYELTLVGPAHEMAFAEMMFSYYDDSEFFNPLGKRPRQQ